MNGNAKEDHLKLFHGYMMKGKKEIEKSEETNEGHTSFVLSPYLLVIIGY